MKTIGTIMTFTLLLACGSSDRGQPESSKFGEPVSLSNGGSDTSNGGSVNNGGFGGGSSNGGSGGSIGGFGGSDSKGGSANGGSGGSDANGGSTNGGSGGSSAGNGGSGGGTGGTTAGTGGTTAGTGGSDPGECSPGETSCSGLNVEVCNSDFEWDAVSTCPFICDDGTCIGVCTPGDQDCGDSQTPRSCGDDGQWEDLPACEFLCSQGDCVTECETGETDCQSSNALECIGGGWQTVESCEFLCSSGSCTGVCSPNDTECFGNSLSTCGADAEWGSQVECPFVCAQGSCTGVCTPGDARCNESDSEVCNFQGQWEVQSTCSTSLPNSESLCEDSGVCGTYCVNGFVDCDGNPDNGCETSVLNDENNCGGCGISCGSGETCSNEICSGGVAFVSHGSSSAHSFDVYENTVVWIEAEPGESDIRVKEFGGVRDQTIELDTGFNGKVVRGVDGQFVIATGNDPHFLYHYNSVTDSLTTILEGYEFPLGLFEVDDSFVYWIEEKSGPTTNLMRLSLGGGSPQIMDSFSWMDSFQLSGDYIILGSSTTSNSTVVFKQDGSLEFGAGSNGVIDMSGCGGSIDPDMTPLAANDTFVFYNGCKLQIETWQTSFFDGFAVLLNPGPGNPIDANSESVYTFNGTNEAIKKTNIQSNAPTNINFDGVQAQGLKATSQHVYWMDQDSLWRFQN